MRGGAEGIGRGVWRVGLEGEGAARLGAGVSAATSAPRSAYGSSSKPGMNGPKPPRHDGADELEHAASVRPQKLLAQKSTFARSAGIPLTA